MELALALAFDLRGGAARSLMHFGTAASHADWFSFDGAVRRGAGVLSGTPPSDFQCTLPTGVVLTAVGFCRNRRGTGFPPHGTERSERQAPKPEET